MDTKVREVTMEFKTSLIVALGGAIGTVSRFGLATLAVPISQSLPWGTILINILGSFVIGFFGTLTLSHGRYPVPETARLFVMVGFCGGFTTFSAFSLQTLDLLRAGAIGRAGINITASVILCLCAVAIGHLAAAQFNGGAVSAVQLAIEDDA